MSLPITSATVHGQTESTHYSMMHVEVMRELLGFSKEARERHAFFVEAAIRELHVQRT